MVCQTGGKNCHREFVGYRVICLECQRQGSRTIMHGETGRCASDRCNEHHKALLRMKDSNLWDHCVKAHGSKIVDFKYEVMRCFPGDPLGRQLDEALRILKEVKDKDSVSMNDKLEWQRPAGIIVTASRM